MVDPPRKVSARHRVTPKYLIWDVTAPDDSVDFAQRMQQFLHWTNLLEATPSTLHFVERPKTQKYPQSRIPLFMPYGPVGGDWGEDILRRALTIMPQLFNPKHGSGRNPSIFYISSHGIPGFLFSEGGVLIGTSTLIGKPGNSKPTHKVTKPSFQWNSPILKYIIFAACRQLDGKPQQGLWARAMRGRNPLHGILSYHDTAPPANACISINSRFFQELRKGQTILKAWRNAHPSGHSADSWAALIHESALNDTVVQWSQAGRLTSSPSPSGVILYFDSKNPKGREVKEPIRYLDMAFQNINNFGAGSDLPPWIYSNPGNVGILNFNLTDASGTNFEPGDRVRLAAAQVRPNYKPPFDITKLFSFVLPASETMDQHKIKVLFKIHDTRIFQPNHFDTYEFYIPTRNSPDEIRMSSWFSLRNRRQIQLKIKVGDFSNGHLSLFYLMGQIRKPDGRIFGIPERNIGETEEAYQRKLADDFQFAVFGLVFPRS